MEDDDNTDGPCRSFYPWYGQNATINLPPFVDRATPTFAGYQYPWSGPSDLFNVDHYLIVGQVQNPGKTGSNSENFPFLDSQVATTMFSAQGLNIPLDEFDSSNGPMASAGSFVNIVQNPSTIYFGLTIVVRLLLSQPKRRGVLAESERGCYDHYLGCPHYFRAGRERDFASERHDFFRPGSFWDSHLR